MPGASFANECPTGYLPSRCDTLLIPTGNGGNHLFVVKTDASPQGQHLLANLTGCRPDRHVDTTCIVRAGEHPFVRQDSFVLYRAAQLYMTSHLAKMVDGWVYRPGAPASEALTQRILEGFTLSPFTPGFIVRFVQDTTR